jgi:hypothetical protein
VPHISLKDVNSASNTSSFFKSRRLHPEANELLKVGTGLDRFLVDHPYQVPDNLPQTIQFARASGNVLTVSLLI